MKENKIIIVTAIGSFSADCVISTLRRNGWTVIGTDIYPATWHYEASLCDAFERAPFATQRANYIEFLLTVCKKYGATGVMPLTDLEIDVLNGNRGCFDEAGIKLFIQPERVLEVARDKYELYKRFKDNGLFEVPATEAVDITKYEDSLLCLPLIAKPRDGRSSEGLKRLSEEIEKRQIWDKEGYIVQALHEGKIFTVDYVRDAEGNDFAVPRCELLRTKNGAGLTVEIIPQQIFQEMTSYVGNQLGIVGCVNMEFILSCGKYYLIDINPRFSAGIAFTSLAGYDMVKSCMNAFAGDRILPAQEIKRCIMQKRYQEVINAMLPE